jgi:galactokinase
MSIFQDFQNLFNASPNLVSAAPGRVNLIGEHVDYNQGLVLPFAIDSVTYCALRLRDDEKILLSSKQVESKIYETSLSNLALKTGPDWTRYILGVIWSLGIKRGVEILIDSEVPQGAGLSSSAALECSVAFALNEALSLGLTRIELAQLTQRAENEFVGVPCGIMDQTISLLGKVGHAILLDCRDLTSKLIPVNFEENGLRLLIIDTQAHHALVDGGYAKRRAQCEEVAGFFGLISLRDLSVSELEQKRSLLDSTLYSRALHVVTEIDRVNAAVSALKINDFRLFGELLNQSHDSLRFQYQVSCPELDCAVEISQKSGALGARMIGGGFGGSAIALVKDGDVGMVASAVERSFAEAGFKSPRFFDAIPSEGARLIDRRY